MQPGESGYAGSSIDSEPSPAQRARKLLRTGKFLVIIELTIESRMKLGEAGITNLLCIAIIYKHVAPDQELANFVISGEWLIGLLRTSYVCLRRSIGRIGKAPKRRPRLQHSTAHRCAGTSLHCVGSIGIRLNIRRGPDIPDSVGYPKQELCRSWCHLNDIPVI